MLGIRQVDPAGGPGRPGPARRARARAAGGPGGGGPRRRRAALEESLETRRFARRIFVSPPWPELFGQDDERCHGFDAAVAEYARLVPAYEDLGYEVVMLPRLGVDERLELVLRAVRDRGAPRREEAP